MDKAYTLLLLPLLLLISLSAYHEIDRIVVPINHVTEELNQSKEIFDMPTKIFPGAKVRVKGTKLAIEKEF